MKCVSKVVCLVVSFFWIASAHAQVEIRIVDVGAGHAAVVKGPNDFYMVYDTGTWANKAQYGKNYAMEAIEEVIPKDQTIDLLVMSHAHSDHTESTVEILQKYSVNTIIRTGYRPQQDKKNEGDLKWDAMNALITKKAQKGELEDINFGQQTLQDNQIYTTENLPQWIGKTYKYAEGEIEVQVLSGFGGPLPSWEKDLIAANNQSNSYRMNMSSVVVHLEYLPGEVTSGHGHSVLFTGDALGRFFGDDNETVRFTEKFLIDRFGCVVWDADCFNYLESSVLIMGHHGAANASSKKFIEAVHPEYVISPSGHQHSHPAIGSMNNVLAFLTSEFGSEEEALARIFRTDIGDDETVDSYVDENGKARAFGKYEWKIGRVEGCKNEPGDNDIYITLPVEGPVEIAQDGRQ